MNTPTFNTLFAVLFKNGKCSALVTPFGGDDAFETFYEGLGEGETAWVAGTTLREAEEAAAAMNARLAC